MIINEYTEDSKTNQTEPYLFINKIYDSYKLSPFKFIPSHYICANEKTKKGVNYIHLIQGLFTYNCSNGLENIYVLFKDNNEYYDIFADDDPLSFNNYPSLLGLCFHDYIFNTTIQNTDSIEYLNPEIERNFIYLWNYIKKIYFFIFVCEVIFDPRGPLVSVLFPDGSTKDVPVITIQNKLISRLLSKNKVIMKFLLKDKTFDVTIFSEIEEFYKNNVIDFTNVDMNKQLKGMYVDLFKNLRESHGLIQSITNLYSQI